MHRSNCCDNFVYWCAYLAKSYCYCDMLKTSRCRLAVFCCVAFFNCSIKERLIISVAINYNFTANNTEQFSLARKWYSTVLTSLAICQGVRILFLVCYGYGLLNWRGSRWILNFLALLATVGFAVIFVVRRIWQIPCSWLYSASHPTMQERA